ncbi:TRADD protein, partial [Polyodon spathula]|nr:TRADD protein [Polyodon spathula]
MASAHALHTEDAEYLSQRETDLKQRIWGVGWKCVSLPSVKPPTDSLGGLDGYEILKIHNTESDLIIQIKFSDEMHCTTFLESYASAGLKQCLGQHLRAVLSVTEELEIDTKLKTGRKTLDDFLKDRGRCLRCIKEAQVCVLAVQSRPVCAGDSKRCVALALALLWIREIKPTGNVSPHRSTVNPAGQGLAFVLQKSVAHSYPLLSSWVKNQRTPTEPSGLLSPVGNCCSEGNSKLGENRGPDRLRDDEVAQLEKTLQSLMLNNRHPSEAVLKGFSSSSSSLNSREEGSLLPSNSFKFQGRVYDDRRLTSSDHQKFAFEIGKQWKKVARSLQKGCRALKDPAIDNLAYEFDKDGLYEQAYQMLNKFLQSEGKKAKLSRLISALEENGLMGIAERMLDIQPAERQ